MFTMEVSSAPPKQLLEQTVAVTIPGIYVSIKVFEGFLLSLIPCHQVTVHTPPNRVEHLAWSWAGFISTASPVHDKPFDELPAAISGVLFE
jgi:hypothetical protein